MQEIVYWRTQSGLGVGLSLADYKLAYLKATAGVVASIDSLWFILWGEGGELAYWRSVSGLPTASLADAKAGFLGNTLTGNLGRFIRLEVSTV